MTSTLGLKLGRRRFGRRVEGSPLATLWSRSPAKTNPRSVLSLDLETTGLDGTRDEIVSFGWVAIDQGRIRLATATHLLVASAAPLKQSATIHGVRDMDRRDGVSLADALDRCLEALAGRTLLVHYAGLDVTMLDRACRDYYGAPLLMPVFDTLDIARRRARDTEQQLAPDSLRLASLRRSHGLPQVSAHNALADALATAELYLAMVPEAQD
ncbi:MAG: exonuclease domain-containing protein [Pseudomonadota bacterium]